MMKQKSPTPMKRQQSTSRREARIKPCWNPDRAITLAAANLLRGGFEVYGSLSPNNHPDLVIRDKQGEFLTIKVAEAELVTS
jgi:hypothetical protein